MERIFGTDGRPTDALLDALREAETIEVFARQNAGEYIDIGIHDYLERLLEEKDMKKADVIAASNLHRIYAYQIFSGVKQPSRDKLLALAVGMRLSLEECQRLLRVAGLGALYVKHRRDSVIIFGLIRGLGLMEINDLLYAMEESLL